MNVHEEALLRDMILVEIFGIRDRMKKRAAEYDAQVQYERNAYWASQVEMSINKLARSVYDDYHYYTNPTVGNSFTPETIENWEEAGQFMDQIRRRMNKRNSKMTELIEFIKPHVNSSNPVIAKIANHIVNVISPRERKNAASYY